MNDVVRHLARHQWVRLHGTPRVTVLVGSDHARAIWERWLAVCESSGTLLDGAFDAAIRDALARATTDPQHRIAVLVAPEALARWRHGRDDRMAAIVDEGRVDVVGAREPRDAARGRAASKDGAARAGAAKGGADAAGIDAAGIDGADFDAAGIDAAGTTNDAAAEIAELDARSVAEAALYEALEATPATKGKFELNGSLPVRHGSRAAEVDLLARGERIAVEIDGVHHFADPECYRRDRRKDLLMQAQGLLVVRLLAEDVLVDVRGSVTIVCQALAYRRGLDAS